MSKLEIIKQNPGQSVSDYAQKFKMLMQRVNTTGGFGQHYIISKFVRRLSPYLMIMVVGHTNTAKSEEEEYEDEALFETDLFQLENENEIHSNSEIDKDKLECIEWPYNEEEFINLYIADVEENETMEQVTIKALIPKEIISTGGIDIGQTLM
ncbi:13343_t:CDS:2 [Funneliformis geosporum]|nr:13343_t:CDS:2 [Funneliformis geosporum]